jgi:hypothetical protein
MLSSYEPDRHASCVLPRQVRRVSAEADAVLSAVSRATRAYTNPKRPGISQWAFRMRALAAAQRKAARQARKAGRGAFGLWARVGADQATARRRKLYRRRMLRRGKSVMWVTAGPRSKRRHRATGQAPWRPKLDNTRPRRAVGDLRKTFRIKRLVAEDQVIATLPGSGTAKDTPRWRRSMRTRLR